MKTEEKYQSVATIGTLGTSSFSIEASAMAFKILSSSLYKNKEEAVVRELASNAWDAHVEAGNIDKPFDIYLPNKIEPKFRIRDYGTGMEKVFLEKLYTTYFFSNKRDSNDVIGKWGIGSKSINCTSDQYSVINYRNGIKYSYHCYLGNSGTPQITLMNEEATTEPNGLEVFFDVKPENFRGFEEAAKKVFQYFLIVPNIKNSTIKINQFNPEWEVVDVNGTPIEFTFDKTRPSAVIMGNVSYPLESESLDLEYSKDCLDNIIIRVPIGCVSVTASRESLEYDEPTKQFLVSTNNTIYSHLCQQYQLDLDACSTRFDVVCLNGSKKYRDCSIVLTGKFDNKIITSNDLYYIFSDIGTNIYNPTKDTPILFHTGIMKGQRRTCLPSQIGFKTYIYIRLPEELIEHGCMRYTGKHLMFYLAEKHGIDRNKCVFVDEIRLKRPPSSNGGSRNIVVEKIAPGSSYYSSKRIDYKKIDPNGGYYLLTENRSLITKKLGLYGKWYDSTIRDFLNNTKDKNSVYIFAKSHLKKILKDFPQLKCFETHLDSLMFSSGIQESADLEFAKKLIESEKEVQIYNLVKKKSLKPDVIVAADKLLKIKNTKQDDRLSIINNLLKNEFKIKPQIDKIKSDVKIYKETIVSEYPLFGLELLNTPSWKVFEDYIVQIDSMTKTKEKQKCVH